MRNPEAQAWRAELPPEDTAPPEGLPTPKPEDWGVTPDQARAMLDRQMCPVCGEGPWKSPLNHVARKHGIDRLTMRDACHMSTRDKVTEAGFRAHCEARGREWLDPERAASISDGVDRRKARRTNAAKRGSESLQRWIAENPDEIARLRAEFRDRMTTPEARAKWDESMKRVRAEREYTDEDRAAFAARMGEPEVEAKRQAHRDATRIDVCTVDGCERPHLAKGYCSGHYKRPPT